MFGCDVRNLIADEDSMTGRYEDLPRDVRLAYDKWAQARFEKGWHWAGSVVERHGIVTTFVNKDRSRRLEETFPLSPAQA
jgi:hypothetical protein